MSDRGEYRPIYTALLDGPDFQALGADARWTLVCVKLSLGMLGIAVVPGFEAALVERTGLPAAKVRRAMRTLEERGWIARERNVAWLVRGFAFEPSMSPDNPRHRTAVARQVGALPRLPIVQRFRDAYAVWFAGVSDEAPVTDGHSLSDSHADRASDSPGQAPRITETSTETVTETETKSSPPAGAPRREANGEKREASEERERLRVTFDAVAARLESDDHREALRRLARASQHPYGWLCEVRAMLDGERGRPGGQVATPAVVGDALWRMSLNGKAPDAGIFRRYCEPAPTSRGGKGRTTSDRTERMVTAATNFVNREE